VGQKTHPRGFRLGVIETWDSKWYHEEKYADWLHEDLEIQKYIKERLYRAGISKIEIERYTDRCNVKVHTARPGIVIGRRGAEIEALQTDLSNLVNKDVRIIVNEIKQPELDSQLVAEAVALQIEHRTNYKQAMKKAIASAMKMGAEGIKIRVAGRLGGHEIARDEQVLEGRVPLHTLRAQIDYGFAEANTKAGKIGVKVWIFKGEVIEKETTSEEESEPNVDRKRRERERPTQYRTRDRNSRQNEGKSRKRDNRRRDNRRTGRTRRRRDDRQDSSQRSKTEPKE